MKVTLEMNFFEAQALFNLAASAVRWHRDNVNRTDLNDQEWDLKEKVNKWQEVEVNFGTRVPVDNG